MKLEHWFEEACMCLSVEKALQLSLSIAAFIFEAGNVKSLLPDIYSKVISCCPQLALFNNRANITNVIVAMNKPCLVFFMSFICLNYIYLSTGSSVIL